MWRIDGCCCGLCGSWSGGGLVGRGLLLSPVTAQPHTGQSRAKWGTEAGWKVTNNDAILPPNLLRCSTDLGLPRVDTTGNQTVCELDSNGLKISNIGIKTRFVFELFLTTVHRCSARQHHCYCLLLIPASVWTHPSRV